jgi:hypothetical protein
VISVSIIKAVAMEKDLAIAVSNGNDHVLM